MKYNRARLCGRKSSANVLTHVHVAHGAGSPPNKSSKFVNHGLLLWNQGRQKWVKQRKGVDQSRLFRLPELWNLRVFMDKSFWLCCCNAPDDRFLRSSKPYPKPIPLAEMVDFLVDIWEQEGMLN